MLVKTLESPLDNMEIKPVNPKGNQSWIFIGRTDAKAETPILWPPHGKSWLIGKDPDAGRDWGRRRRGRQRMRWLDGITNLMDNEFEQVPGVGDGLGSLACCSSWDCKESDMTEWLKWTDATLESFYNLHFIHSKIEKLNILWLHCILEILIKLLGM